MKCGCSIYFFINSVNRICRGTGISKYLRQSLGLRDNESRLYILFQIIILILIDMRLLGLFIYLFIYLSIYFSELSSDIPTIVFLALACVLTLAILVIFLEEHVYLQKIHMHDPIRQRRVVTLLGLYPVSTLDYVDVT